MDNNKKRRRPDIPQGTAGMRSRTSTNKRRTSARGGDSIMPSGNSTTGVLDASSVPGNFYLTIWDEPSNESQEFSAMLEANDLSNLKQEVHTQTMTALQLPVHYRVVNSVQRQIKQEAGHVHLQQPQQQQQQNQSTTAFIVGAPASATICSSAKSQQQSPMTATVLQPTTTSVQLPSGCEIFLVKECAKQSVETRHDNNNANEGRDAGVCISSPPNYALLNAENASDVNRIGRATEQDENGMGKGNGSGNGNSNGNFVVETCRKRDDKRRATHNEVERRRRDKINSWIFRLKEMLPVDGLSGIGGSVVNENPKAQMQRNVTNRTPPNDSKSQILIKACEYIKSLQEEVISLRECLKENDNLRVSNLQLQNEVNQLRSGRKVDGLISSRRDDFDNGDEDDDEHCDGVFPSSSGNFTVTLNSINSNNNDGDEQFLLAATTNASSTAGTASANANPLISNDEHDLSQFC